MTFVVRGVSLSDGEPSRRRSRGERGPRRRAHDADKVSRCAEQLAIQADRAARALLPPAERSEPRWTRSRQPMGR